MALRKITLNIPEKMDEEIDKLAELSKTGKVPGQYLNRSDIIRKGIQKMLDEYKEKYNLNYDE